MRISTVAIIIFLFWQLPLSLISQPAARNQAYTGYIEKYRDIAVKKMHEYKIPASITLAQGLLESGIGNSELAVNANNHFGIKCHKEWTGMTYTMDDDARDECFRKYASAEESFNDHSLFLTSRPRYAGLFSLDIRDYKGWAHGLKSAGYATNPRYAEILIRIIEENELYLYDSAPPGPFASGKDKKMGSENLSPMHVPVTGIQLSPSNVKFDEIAEGNRPVYLNNGVKLTFARAGDDVHAIAKDFGIHSFQLLRYNEMGKHEVIQDGQAIYITPKKRKVPSKRHTVSDGESMRDISQFYGIRLQSLYKLNEMQAGHEPQAGTVLKLSK
ncbi:glucosaminidase domain-containing protein [Lentimicrobium sp.]|jgi:LysM repeat protein|uniref:glucosaminidase domain-containing protein n=1 Tax=Lentimicrobium sp. TaxID=2034841 RepID=UPI002BE5E840|nr:glucosaminidase domain-containing protein [Lentimicrobium sp.]HOP14075.1 glucosaminidase domain-containing protein [Lentimicrobium sp.]